jgi:hypothetical protein
MEFQGALALGRLLGAGAISGKKTGVARIRRAVPRI